MIKLRIKSRVTVTKVTRPEDPSCSSVAYMYYEDKSFLLILREEEMAWKLVLTYYYVNHCEGINHRVKGNNDKPRD